MHEPTPEQYNPPLTRRAHAWRTATVLLISAVLWVETALLQWQQARVLFWLDLGVGLATLVLSFYRRRWPLTVALLTNAASVVSLTAAGPSTLASVSLATRRVVWQVVLVGLVGLVAAMVFPLMPMSAHRTCSSVDEVTTF